MSGQDEISEMAKFVIDYEMTEFEHVADVSNGLWKAFDITAQPSFVFINDDGNIRRNVGSLTPEEISAELDLLLAS